MLFIRSLLFNLLFMISTAIFSVLVIIFRIFGFSASWIWARAWSGLTFAMLRLICGIRLEVEGREHFPEEACVVMAKHQSAAETIAMPILVPPYVWILKRNLYYIPFFGWALAVMGTIAIRRGNPREAIKQVIQQGSKFLKDNRWVVIFPEGTRTHPGEKGNYQPGGIVLAHKAEAGILPMAHNAGVCWPKRGFIKKPGTIRVRFLPYIPAAEVAATKRNDLLKRLEADIESATLDLGG
ncbi:MAG: 1-acyl-sn-glycerol-3-phosphate acyltransferase [Zetaproteobacteria bacterium CG12_big_fil_rev_8_21_14_0_65_55_1124]|nr:MAG: 1-acyl-sn-glycerol-3-phosphate acyltransferase [Zetaproteobacteria bacterium CG1_02_55_237]PIS20145.1 MAG: 1-acyl-sn-glycerol-3-phosphate acyltransferase [Zetaproteobacteria bacterium CG08_land_8_20_14_0_20_55_17]PIW42732.1 MAG: 1-acyl-sn-glycerol-3-phosphate acyltransferase [Zetaproteobacteria bacterium CG12_big_fil_rev_8_21_14_0_65_55_1124]PIY53746.1 MAG: 1-acyl-sn-glycerol-3-phosphate acyltransferase [Zetaproteobacteria bacterium CG_4_10_14_0_8_um_filter_55_43]PIZ38792.1 MAG: 1-acyl-